jgi:hypothetical protein
MFRTIEKEGGSNGPAWLSDHPNPGNRSEYIEKEAQSLRVTNPVNDTAGFERVKSHLKTLPKAPSSEEVARSRQRGGNGEGSGPTGTLGRVDAPSGRYRQYTEGNLFQISVPGNWRELPGSSAVTFAPTGAYGAVNGQSVFTHGVEVGVARAERHDLPDAMRDFIDDLSQNNRRLRQRSEPVNAIVSGRRALQVTLDNVSDATGAPEIIQLVTTRLRDGSLFYVIAVAPEGEYRAYEPVFQQVVRSIRLND